ncbi:hypothetical protein ACIOG7_17145 [Streptomyces sp. NPDC087894]|uniref:hypothetical protein n=1 Tax=Streptomyces sp. NPDC087894 TaxID=3365816 RepID=UPI003821FEB6
MRLSPVLRPARLHGGSGPPAQQGRVGPPQGRRRVQVPAGPVRLGPAGAPLLSNPVDLPVPALSHLSISLYLPEPVETCTGHAMGVQTCWTVPGNAVADPTGPGSATSLPLVALLSAFERAADRWFGAPAR